MRTRIYQYRIVFPVELNLDSLLVESAMHIGTLFRDQLKDIDITKCRIEKIEPPIVVN